MGRRLLALFISCALVPVASLAFWSHRQVRVALEARAQGRLEVLAKEHAVAIVDRGLAIADLLRALESTGSSAFNVDSARRPRIWTGSGGNEATLDPAQRQHLSSGRPLILLDAATPEVARYLLSDSAGHNSQRFGEVPLRRLLGFAPGEEMDPALCVVSTEGGRVLQCSQGTDQAIRAGALEGTPPGWLVARRAVFLRYEFGAPDLEVIALRSRDEVVAAAGSMGTLFLLVATLSILVVFVTGHQQIRRITAPLDRLTAAAERVRGGDLAVRVPEEGTDELAGLARSFNTMSASIARQVGALAALDEVDRAALESGDREQVSHVALASLKGTGEVQEALVIFPAEFDEQASTVVRTGYPVQQHDIPAATSYLNNERPLASAEHGEWMATLGVAGAAALEWLSVPLRHDGRMEGLLVVGSPRGLPQTGQAAQFIHQMGDRLAMALANRRLVDDLDAFSLGTLTAFARAADANSSWTAGHSERVTTASVALGSRLGLGPRELEVLRRGGLLHDIGKIGVPTSILDKPSKLDAEELRLMRRHPVIGHEILSPIPAMRDVLPIVRSHHEWMNGRGYPDGLSGDEIPLMARVLAVADVHDALVSDRPYRRGLSAGEALAAMRAMAGPHLDPTLVRVFLEMQAEQGLRGIGPSSPASVPLVPAGVSG